MSNIWTIHVSDAPSGRASEIYYCHVRFKLDSWVLWLFKYIPKEACSQPTNPVSACWVDKEELRRDTQDIIQVDAMWLKECPFHEPSWTEDRRIRSQAATAYLKALPDDWPCFLYQT